MGSEIGPDHDVRVENLDEALNVAARAAARNAVTMSRWLFDVTARQGCTPNSPTGSTGQLTRRRCRLAQHRCDLLEGQAESVMQDECDSLGRFQPIEHDLQRQAEGLA